MDQSISQTEWANTYSKQPIMNSQLRIMKKERGLPKGSKANTSTYCGSETNEQHTDRLPEKDKQIDALGLG